MLNSSIIAELHSMNFTSLADKCKMSTLFKFNVHSIIDLIDSKSIMVVNNRLLIDSKAYSNRHHLTLTPLYEIEYYNGTADLQ